MMEGELKTYREGLHVPSKILSPLLRVTIRLCVPKTLSGFIE
ncbi:hypothetical protein SAMN05443247_03835 [Bradyrhizobium erythrophlei]|nr:hypothetical protein SAMN05443247_03835 [Bradyrhizobium erythrophlei]